MWAIVAASAVVGAFMPPQPTGHVVIDLLYRAGLAALVTAAASRAKRATWLFLAGVALAASRGYWLIPAGLSLALAFSAAFRWRRERRVGALVGALAIPALFSLGSWGFTGLTALVAAIAIVPVLISAYRISSDDTKKIWRRLTIGFVVLLVICSLPIMVATILARGPIGRGIAAARGAFSGARSGQQRVAVAGLDRASSQFEKAKSLVASPLTAVGGIVPVISQHREALAEGTTSALHVAIEGASTAKHANYPRLRYRSGRIDTDRLAAMAPALGDLSETLHRARHHIDASQSAWLVPPIDHRLLALRRQVDEAIPDTVLAARAARVGPSLLGADQPKRYLVVFMTPAEQRGLGGFIGAYGELTADHGRLRLVHSDRGAALFDPRNLQHRSLDGPAEYVKLYAQFHPAQSPADATFSNDFPAVGDVLAQLYPQSGGRPVDGVMALDPKALAALLRFTGPVAMPGVAQPLTAANAEEFLLRTQYLLFPNQDPQRHDYLQDALRVAFDKLTHGSLPGPRRLAKVLDPQVREHRLLFWSKDPAAESLVERMGMDGAYPRPRGQDLLSLTTQNEGQSKIDVYLHRQIRYQVRVDKASGQVSATATITLINDALASGLPRYVIGNNFDQPPGTNETYLSLYTPLLLDRLEIGGQPVAPQPGLQKGSNVYGVSVHIPPEGRTTVTFQLGGTLTKVPKHGYQLTYRPQPTVNPDVLELTVQPAGQGAVRPVKPVSKTGPTATFRGAIIRDRTLTVNLSR